MLARTSVTASASLVALWKRAVGYICLIEQHDRAIAQISAALILIFLIFAHSLEIFYIVYAGTL
jgi:hypothetical protein